LFVNLPVRDLGRSKAFFSTLGVTSDPRFTDEKAACMVMSDEAFVMLLTEPFFQTFTTRRLCDTAHEAEGLFGPLLQEPGRSGRDRDVGHPRRWRPRDGEAGPRCELLGRPFLLSPAS
jgi:hypothetical protein